MGQGLCVTYGLENDHKEGSRRGSLSHRFLHGLEWEEGGTWGAVGAPAPSMEVRIKSRCSGKGKSNRRR